MSRSARLRVGTVLLGALASAAFAAAALARPPAASAASAEMPGWLMAHAGEGSGAIALPVLQRARSLYLSKLRQGEVRNGCYFAMDATRPNEGAGQGGGRFYVICEADQVFRSIPAGHGGGRALGGAANFVNGRRCAKNFGNAQDSELTTGGAYVTGQIKTSFKGYYRASATQTLPFLRSFIPFDGEGSTANARARDIGGHAAVTLKGVCLRKDPGNPYADPQGYVRFGTLVDYSGGRSNGCTSWSSADAAQIADLVKDEPTTLYIYPEASDIRAVARSVSRHRAPAQDGLYWNAACLKDIRAPRYWSRETLEPVIARYKAEHPAPPPAPPPICKGG